MEICETRFSWITMMLGMRKEDNWDFLLMDPVARFESILSRFPTQEVSSEFLENGILYLGSTSGQRHGFLSKPFGHDKADRRGFRGQKEALCPGVLEIRRNDPRRVKPPYL